MNAKCETIACELSPKWGDIVLAIVTEAAERFSACGAENDFCLQSSGMDSITFGGTNRVTWTARYGYRLDCTACTARFHGWWELLYVPRD